MFDKTDSKDPTKREDYSIQTLQTTVPLWRNVKDSLLVLHFVFCVTDYAYGRTAIGQRF